MNAWEKFGKQQDDLRRLLRKKSKEAMERMQGTAGDPRSGRLFMVFMAAVLGFVLGGPALASAFAFGAAGAIHYAGGWHPQPSLPIPDKKGLEAMAGADVQAALEEMESEQAASADPRYLAALMRRFARCKAYGLKPPSIDALTPEMRVWLLNLKRHQLVTVSKLPSRRLHMHLQGGIQIQDLPRFRSDTGIDPTEHPNLHKITPRRFGLQESGFRPRAEQSA